MSTFVLVHGAWHGAWCWQRLLPELDDLGHHAVTVDLPNHRDAGLEDQVRAIENAVAGNAEDVVLVGHSVAGLFLPVVTDRVSPRHVVFVCGMLAAAGESMRDLTVREDVFAPGWPDLAARQHVPGDGSSAWPADAAIEAFYQDCDADMAKASAARLRPQFWRFQKEATPLRQYPATPATYILCRDDKVISPAWSRRAAAQRLGVQPIELDGGHAPFLSRPGELAGHLDAVLR